MSRTFRKKGQDVARSLTNTRFSLRVYSIWALASFVVFGMLGIYPQARNLYLGIKTLKEMEEINQSLRNKVSFINQEYDKVQRYKNAFEKLDRIMPVDYEVQNFIVELSFATRKSGYSLRSARAEKSDSQVRFQCLLVGEGDIGKLVESIEAMNRASQLNNISFEGENVWDVECSMDIFVLK